MNQKMIENYVNRLQDVRGKPEGFDYVQIGAKEPSGIDDAYAIQDTLLAKIEERPSGWKVGCTSKMAQEHTKTDEPFYGRMFKSSTYQTPTKLNLSNYFDPIVEPEIAFKMGESLLPGNAPFDKNDVLDAIETIFPAIELVDCRYAGGWPLKISPTISDNGVHAAFIAGDKVENFESIDLAAITVSVQMNGKICTDGIGSNSLGDPINAVLWLANRCIEYGHHIAAGDVISSGNIANKAIKVTSGDEFVVDFAEIGKIELSF